MTQEPDLKDIKGANTMAHSLEIPGEPKHGIKVRPSKREPKHGTTDGSNESAHVMAGQFGNAAQETREPDLSGIRGSGEWGQRVPSDEERTAARQQKIARVKKLFGIKR